MDFPLSSSPEKREDGLANSDPVSDRYFRVNEAEYKLEGSPFLIGAPVYVGIC